ncbi:MAG: succinate dehydrogenase, cytochrome b556 subunit [Rhodocyclaceae bacterium]|nr:succinate dehydrogenase, cytochrome b556 subunit [Rhodocyclaceae bacterium]
MTAQIKTRPKHLNLWQIKLPAPAVASILHRVSGFGMFLLLPLLLWLLEASLASQESFDALKNLLARPVFKLLMLGLAWAFFHHLCMGVRILLIDVHIGVDKETARKSAFAVFLVSLMLTLGVGVALW